MKPSIPDAITDSSTESSRTPRTRRGPLAGIRVADFCWAGVGAGATRFLADFGAEVIKIENRVNLDRTRRLPVYKGGGARAYGHEDANPDVNKGGVFNNYNRNKLSIAVDMRTPKGKALIRDLIGKSSVVTENFAPGVMERWGLTYEDVKKLRPDVIMARMSGFGHDGPYAHYKSYGPVIQAMSGMSFIAGLPGQMPSGWGLSYMDNQASYYNSAALLAAIFRRMRTGEGTEIDVSAQEVGVRLLGPMLLDYAVNGRKSRRADFPPGNRLEDPQAAPHGVYPSAGDDRWIAITVFNQEEWQRFVKALGNVDWTRDARFASPEARFQNQDALDAFVSEWTRTRSPHDAMNLLQTAGVRAGAVQNMQDIHEVDPQIAFRGPYFKLDHPVIGDAIFEGIPAHMSSTTVDNWRSGPLLGEDNAFVLKQILGVSDTEYDELESEGIIQQ